MLKLQPLSGPGGVKKTFLPVMQIYLFPRNMACLWIPVPSNSGINVELSDKWLSILKVKLIITLTGP